MKKVLSIILPTTQSISNLSQLMALYEESKGVEAENYICVGAALSIGLLKRGFRIESSSLEEAKVLQNTYTENYRKADKSPNISPASLAGLRRTALTATINIQPTATTCGYDVMNCIEADTINSLLFYYGEESSHCIYFEKQATHFKAYDLYVNETFILENDDIFIKWLNLTHMIHLHKNEALRTEDLYPENSVYLYSYESVKYHL